MLCICLLYWAYAKIYIRLPERALAALEVTRSVSPQRISVGGEVVLETVIFNRRWLPLPWLRLNALLSPAFKGEALIQSITASLLFFERVVHRERIRVPRRGVYKLDVYRSETGDVFGWASAEAEKRIDSAPLLWVYPKVRPVNQVLQAVSTDCGEVSVRRWLAPDPMLAMGTRDYTDRDPMSSIDWKATARLGKFQVRQLDHTANPGLQLFLDLQSTPCFWSDVRDKAVESSIAIAAAIIQDACALGIPVGLATNHLALNGRRYMDIPLGKGPSQWTALMDTLALCTTRRSDGIEQIMRGILPRVALQTTVVLITSYLSVALAATLDGLVERGYPVVLVNLSEMTVPVPPLHRSIRQLQANSGLEDA